MTDTYTPTRPLMSQAELRTHKTADFGRDYRQSDDGYGDMAVAERQGWRTLSSWGHDGWNLGDWPYVTFQVCERDGKFLLQQICEGDHTRYAFDTAEDRSAALDYLFLWYAAGQPWAPVTYEDRAVLEAGEFTPDLRFRGPYRAR